MDRFEAAKWMVEHPGQRMVDSDGDEWWWDYPAEGFFLNGEEVNPFCDCIRDIQFEPKVETIKPHRRNMKPWRTRDGVLVARIPERFEGKTVELKVKACDE